MPKHIQTWVLQTLCCCLFFFKCCSAVSAAEETLTPVKKFAPVILQLKWFHQFQFAGYYAALHKGYFEEEGLDVTIKEGGPKVKVNDEVLSGRANFGVLASELIQKRAQGEPLVLVAVIMQHSIRTIIVRADSGINSPCDLVNHRIMINPNEDTEFLAMLTAEGISSKLVDIIPKDNTANEKFISGDIDGMNGSIGNQPFLFQAKGIPVKTIRPISYGIDFYGDSLFTSETEVKKHPDRVAAFRKAVIRGWDYAMANSPEIIDLIITEYNSKKTPAQLQFEADAIRELILPELVEIGHVNQQRIERIAQTYAGNHIVPPDFSLHGFIYDPDQNEAKAQVVHRLIAGIIFFSAIALLFGSVLVLINSRLKKMVNLRTDELSETNKNLFHEIEERNKAKQIISERDKKFRTLFENMAQGVFYQSADGQLTDVNQAALKMFGITREQFLERDSHDQAWKVINEEGEELSPNDHPSMIALNTGNSVLNQVVGVFSPTLKDYRWLSINALPEYIEGGDMPVQVFVTMHDITDLKTAKNKLQRAHDDLERRVEERTIELQETYKQLLHAEKLSAIGSLSASIAHEFNNPLAGITSVVQGIKRRATFEKEDAVLIDMALQECDRIKKLIQSLRDFNRPSSGRFALVDIHAIIDSLLLLSKHEHTTKKIRVKRNYAEDLPLIFAVGDQIKQVLLNILNNAVDACEEGGGKISIGTESSENDIAITIQDTGKGITPEHMDKIFAPFFSTKPEVKGTGLGLSVSYGIIKKHGGRIDVKSKLQKGTAFTITLPKNGV